MRYEVVDKPIGIERSRWYQLFANLPVNKAVKMNFPTKKKAQLQGISIGGCLRSKRKFPTPILISWRVTPNADDTTFDLYVWRREESVK